MKIRFLLLFITTVIFFGCKKDTYEPQYVYEIVYKKNGIEEKMIPTQCRIILKSTGPSITELQLAGITEDFKHSIGIFLTIKGDVKVGEYSSLQNNTDLEVNGDYYFEVGQANEIVFSLGAIPGRPTPDFRLKLIKVQKDVISGTFSCNFLYDWNTGESITLTEGRFTAKRRS